MFRQPADPSSEAEALERCRASVESGSYVLSSTGEARMKLRGFSGADIRHILANARTAAQVARPDGGGDGKKSNWTIAGSSMDGADAELLVAFDGDVTLVL